MDFYNKGVVRYWTATKKNYFFFCSTHYKIVLAVNVVKMNCVLWVRLFSRGFQNSLIFCVRTISVSTCQLFRTGFFFSSICTLLSLSNQNAKLITNDSLILESVYRLTVLKSVRSFPCFWHFVGQNSALCWHRCQELVLKSGREKRYLLVDM